jgi:hypothetical protein
LASSCTKSTLGGLAAIFSKRSKYISGGFRAVQHPPNQTCAPVKRLDGVFFPCERFFESQSAAANVC